MKQAENSFLDEVMRQTPDGDRLRTCLQCGSCSGSCPNGADMDYTPRAIFALIQAGERETVLAANTMFSCVSCYFCVSRCPREIPITDLMYTLKRIAVKEGKAANGDAVALARTFNHFIRQYGRSFELGLASRYYLTRKPGSMLGMGPLGISMFRHGRLHLRPNKIKNIDQLNAILDEARAIGGDA